MAIKRTAKVGEGMNFKSKDLLGLRDMSAEEIDYILETAKTMKYIISAFSNIYVTSAMS